MIAGCGFKIRGRLKLTSRVFIPILTRHTLNRLRDSHRHRDARICCDKFGVAGTTDI